ncbi:MAG TPA: hypothetical protein VFT22_10930 [Kofleriaceae bacterium]|nr:hypothetical protein [Kofleriaceae bacterium]
MLHKDLHQVRASDDDAPPNECYSPELWRELTDFYVGGYQLLRRAEKYMPKIASEGVQTYKERIASASYINHLAQIIDYFVANLFSQEIVVTEPADADDQSTLGSTALDEKFYSAFALDADLKGTAFGKLLRQVFPWALLKGKSILAVDLPQMMGPEPITRAEEDDINAARAYCFEVPVEQLIDWEYDEQGNFALAVLHREFCRRTAITQSRDEVTHEFKVWTQDPDTKVVRWELYQIKLPKGKEPGPNDDVPLVDAADTSFPWVPLIELKMPMGLWVGNKIGCLAKEHFQRRNALKTAENKSLFAIPCVGLGPEISAIGEAMPAEVQQNPNRLQGPTQNVVTQFQARGFVTHGSDDKVYFAEPSGSAYQIVDDQLEKLVDEMFRIVHQMAASVASTKTAVGRSGASKREDRSATEIVLGALGALVRDWSKRVYDTVSRARKENIVWTPRGLDKYELVDRETLLEEATSVDLVTIPSKTFKKNYKTKIALALLNDVPAATQDVIREEIEDGVEQEGELAQIRADAEKDALENQQPVGPKMPMAPSAKTPKPAKPMPPKPGANAQA